ncbi:MAG: phosphonate metabolism protein PhnM [Aquificaceae bacterium]|nr:phosphonate metabolism protein PhnM [Aquificaceae bacterium]MDW8097698.1 phosphonate metabolism protein PhnM [Aquificaceae bacterium]
MRFVIENARVVLPDRILEGASVQVEDGHIVKVEEVGINSTARRIDAKRDYLLPGLVDIHTDAIEKEVEPRPGVLFPRSVAIFQADKRFVSSGVTTVLHSVSFAERELGLRSNEEAKKLVDAILDLKPQLSCKTGVHIRFEVSNSGAVEYVSSLIESGQIDLLSFMDHTPGQGQFKTEEAYFQYMEKTYKMDRSQVRSFLLEKSKVLERAEENIKVLAELCRSKGVVMASHDDDNVEKVLHMHQIGVSVSDFPVDLESASLAKELGMYVCLGAPNVLRGKSHAGNLSARDAILKGACNIIATDYLPWSALNAVFLLYREGIVPLHEAVNLASLNPARAIGVGDQVGSIQAGKRADLVQVHYDGRFPRVLRVYVDGRQAYSLLD